MAGKKRPSSKSNPENPNPNKAADEETHQPSLNGATSEIVYLYDKSDPTSAPPPPKKMRPMEVRKQRKELAKQRHAEAAAAATKPVPHVSPATAVPSIPVAANGGAAGLHLNLFGDLASAELSVREAAAEQLMSELKELQRVNERGGRNEGEKEGEVKMEADKDDGLEDCAPTVQYAVRRLIRGISSSREFARQGFALCFTLVVGAIHEIKARVLLKLIVDLLEVSSSMKGPEVKDNLLGRLFAFGALARSGRISGDWMLDKTTSLIRDFVSEVILLAGKKRYLSEPAVTVILDLAEKLPDDALLTEVLQAPGVDAWLERAAKFGDPDALFLSLKLQQRANVTSEVSGKLLPHPFSPERFFTQDHLLSIASCFKESTFCLPRVHSLWPVVINMLIAEPANQEDPAGCVSDAAGHVSSAKKHKKSRKGGSAEELSGNLQSFCEVVIEGSLMLSSHDRKHLAFNVLLMLLPKLPASCIQTVLSSKIIHGLMDVLSNQSSLLHNAGQHFLKELIRLVSDDDDRRVAAIISLQKYSAGRFDCITKTKAVKELVAKFRNGPGCLAFVHNLMSLFVDEVPVTDEPSDHSQTTDENSEMGSIEDKDPFGQGSTDLLKNWVIDTMPRVLKNLKLNSSGSSLTDSEIAKAIEEKFRVQTEIMKFLAVQGLFSASLGTEVTSFELQEKFTWPKAAISSSLCRDCIEQLQILLEDAQKSEGSNALNDVECNDTGSYLMRFINTVCNIPSVSLYRTLSSDDENAFKKILAMEAMLFHEEKKADPLLALNKMHAMRYLLIQLLLQVLVRPDEFSEAAIELIICCKKAFSTVGHSDSSDEEKSDENGVPRFMDVLVGTCLSLLPHVSGPVCFAIEQVFRVFCDEITDTGLLDMLKVVKKDLKPPRHQTHDGDSDDDDDNEDEDFIGIEEDEETGAETAETGDSDDNAGQFEGKLGATVVNEVKKDHHDGFEEMVDDEAPDEFVEGKDATASDDSDGMDDDAMFRIDPYIARIFKERKLSGSDSVQSQLVPFKLRVLSLLEIYLQKNPGKTQVLKVYSFLMQTFVNSHVSDGGEQLKQRISGILQKRVFKAKEYPKGNDIVLTSLQALLEKSLKLASRSRFKTISSLAQNATFWIFKIINAKNSPKEELQGVVDIVGSTLVDYFDSRRSRLKLGFVKELIRRYPWVGQELFGFILERCRGINAEYRKIQTLELIEWMMKSWMRANVTSVSNFLSDHLITLGELVHELLRRLPEKQSKRAEVRRFCNRVLHVISEHNLGRSFLEALNPDAYSLFQSELGDAIVALA